MGVDTEVAAAPAAWPVPVGLPLYATVEEAARIAGVSRDAMYGYVNSAADPLPCITFGKSKKLVRVAALPEYLRRRETAR